MEFRLVHNQKEKCHYDHILFIMKVFRTHELQAHDVFCEMRWTVYNFFFVRLKGMGDCIGNPPSALYTANFSGVPNADGNLLIFSSHSVQFYHESETFFSGLAWFKPIGLNHGLNQLKKPSNICFFRFFQFLLLFFNLNTLHELTMGPQ